MNRNRYYDIYLITIDNKDQFFFGINNGAFQMSQMLGVNYIWMAPESKNTQRQIDILNAAVERGANAILISVNDPVRMSPPIEDAKAKAVKIIYVDTPAYEEAITTLSTDNFSAGIAAANEMLEQLMELGVVSGSLGIIGVNDVTDSTVKRENGFRSRIAEDGRYKIPNTRYGNGDPVLSQQVAESFFKDFPNMVGVFATNEGSTAGLGNAIRDNHPMAIGIGFDSSDIILKLLAGGYLKAIIVQNPFTMGYLGMAEAVAALQGFPTGPDVLNTGVTVLLQR